MVILSISTALFVISTIYLMYTNKQVKNEVGDVKAKFDSTLAYTKTLEEKLATQKSETKSTKATKQTPKAAPAKRGPKPKAK